ncbi:2-succinyl-6-hydroxy-2,4-cyclohexadiene-1-carboxylate synthase [Vibrio aquimaris]|uniref:Putative 2-succinyl-6-hydroxy-2,4-cyclohexadiene-1-carboxylate synthase n=1 Tax=Vibrio aquimaris TaxID=2587862 RepID=A0A5P9CKB8_9VIBR|nr:2-succinyl-6-hydroxy-2,4-cyclohexadiene-1-carboxylate synthase [Vibrio aquimaris]QFT26694.1 2-succinyl-6-hydroxy-2,4-cyclohexadiene-1-carboxylate synthase [Vibrio aquimaris]
MLASRFYNSDHRRSLPVIVCLHGFLGDSDDWAQCVEFLADYPVLCIDLPGHGRSKNVHCADFKSCCDQISNVLSHQVPEQAPIVLVGYSMGARIVMAGLANEYFSAFNIKLLICESGHFGLDDEEHKKQRLINDKVWANRFSHETIETVLEDWYQQIVFQSLSDAQKTDLVRKRAKNFGSSVASMLLATTLAKQDFLLDILKTSSVSIHCICGDKDKKFKQLNASSGLPYTCIQQVGHNVHIEDPQAFTNIVKSNVRALSLDAT